MQIITTTAEMQRARREITGTVALVPTMGYLHEGHLSLVRRAHAENETVIATIFVNPTQFGPNEDLDSYPRDMPRDLALLAAENVDLVFAPPPEELYPPGFQTWVEPGDLATRLEGKRRPGHFRGVATIVTKLYNLTQPTRAYFGQKDAQQAIILQRLARDLNYDIDVVICPIVRERHGLALSSRNSYLSAEERQRASVLYHSLTAAGAAYRRGERSARAIRQTVLALLEQEPLARIEYVSIADLETLEEIEGAIERPVLISLAVHIGKARLIDNLILQENVRTGTEPENQATMVGIA